MNTTNPRKNIEGYSDPTAYNALKRIQPEEYRKKHTYRPLVFICSPFAGEIERNINNARRYCTFCRETRNDTYCTSFVVPAVLG